MIVHFIKLLLLPDLKSFASINKHSRELSKLDLFRHVKLDILHWVDEMKPEQLETSGLVQYPEALKVRIDACVAVGLPSPKEFRRQLFQRLHKLLLKMKRLRNLDLDCAFGFAIWPTGFGRDIKPAYPTVQCLKLDLFHHNKLMLKCFPSLKQLVLCGKSMEHITKLKPQMIPSSLTHVEFWHESELLKRLMDTINTFTKLSKLVIHIPRGIESNPIQAKQLFEKLQEIHALSEFSVPASRLLREGINVHTPHSSTHRECVAEYAFRKLLSLRLLQLGPGVGEGDWKYMVETAKAIRDQGRPIVGDWTQWEE